MALDEKAIFVAATELPDAAARQAYLQKACASDPQLLNRLREQLSAHEGSRGPLDRRPPALGVTVDSPLSEGPGTVIGPFKLLEQIGEGGFGVVFMAEQQEPVRRKVALKVLKPGMDTRQIVARFEAERQALAVMDHPNIAKVFDGGTTGIRDQGLGIRRRIEIGDQGLGIGQAEEKADFPISLIPNPWSLLEGPTSSWNSSRACPSPSSAIRTICPFANGLSSLSMFARPFSTPIRKASSTAT